MPICTSRIFKPLAALAVASVLLALPGCVSESRSPKHLKPISQKTLSMMEEKGMGRLDPIVIRIFKEESELEVWKRNKSGRYALLNTYPICAWSGVLGPKVKEGDRQAPEGFYTITPGLMNPNSSYYLSFNIGYPNAYDKAYDRTGSNLMVHGACSSAGCYSMTDDQIADIYAIARDAFKGGQRAFQVQAYPFRMTPENLARHRNNPNMAFWKNLKQGSDHFEVTGTPPEVAVCGKKYVFDVTPENPKAKLEPTAACPVLTMPEELRIAVADKEARDDQAVQVAVAELLSKPAAGVSQPTIMVAENEAKKPEPASSAPSSFTLASALGSSNSAASVNDSAGKSESGSFLSRMMNAANPRSWGGHEGAKVERAVVTDVPMPAPRPERTAMSSAPVQIERSPVTGYAPTRGLGPREDSPFAVFEMFTQVGRAWAPRDSQAARLGIR
ncbi:MAG: murein L,D-transpeptidase [Rhodobiaceae bacterium]|nr:murein L,D-transpeptidase [Rhodobiaceae bacterium]